MHRKLARRAARKTEIPLYPFDSSTLIGVA